MISPQTKSLNLTPSPTGAPGCIKKVIGFYIICDIKIYVLGSVALELLASGCHLALDSPSTRDVGPFFGALKGLSTGIVGYG